MKTERIVGEHEKKKRIQANWAVDISLTKLLGYEIPF